MRLEDTAPLRRFLQECRWPLYACLAIKLAIYLLSGDRYGYISDELYFLQASQRLDLGYLDFPPMIAWVTALARSSLGDSLYALRFVPFVCGVLVSWIGVAITHVLGGGKVASWITAIIIATAPAFVSFHAILTMNALDQVWWASTLLLFTLYLRSADPRLMLGMGVVIGLGLLTKLFILALAVSMLAVLLVSQPKVLRERFLYLSLLLAAAIASPFLYWQIVNDFPFFEFWRAYKAVQHESFVMDSFLLSQVLTMNPGHLMFWLPGIYELLVGGDRRWRPLGWLALLVFVLCYLSGVRFYFFAPMYLLLVAGGAIFWDRMLRNRGHAIKSGVLGLIVFNSILVLPTGAPLLPAKWLQQAMATMGRGEGSDDDGATMMTRMFPHFAEMHGWQRLSDKSVAQYEAHRGRFDNLKIVASHFGQASAINHYNTDAGIPWACSGHMHYYYWCRGEELTAAIAVGYSMDELSRVFATVEVLEKNDCELCMQRERESFIALVGEPKLSREELWEALKKFYIF